MKDTRFPFMALVALTLLLAFAIHPIHAQTVVKSAADSFYTFAGVPNPFQVDEDPNSIEAAAHVSNILCGPNSLALQLGVQCIVHDRSLTWNATVFGPIPAEQRFDVQVTGAKPVLVTEFVNLFNTADPNGLRVTLNKDYGIGTLGPLPAPLPFGYQFAYVTNYYLDPASLDPGPIPANILAYIANLEKAKRKAAVQGKK